MTDQSRCESEVTALQQEIKLLQEQVRQTARVKRLWQNSNEKLKKARDQQQLLQRDLENKIREIEKARLLLESIASNDRAIIANMSEGVMITSPEGNIRQVNPAFEKITGYSASQVIGKNPNFLRSGKHDREFYRTLWQSLIETSRWQGEITNRNASGEIYIQDTSITAVRDWNGETVNFVAVMQDVTSKREYEKQLRELALYDNLTGLANRRLFREQVTTALHMANRREINFAILFIDLDGFKPVNDTYGHEAGDYVLQQIALRLKKCLREDDEASRFGGDEFIMLLSKIECPEDAQKAAMRLLENLSLPISWKGRSISISASIGIAIYPQDGEDYDTLIKAADDRMYNAKQEGKARVSV